MKNILIKGLFVFASVIFVISSASAMTCANLTKNLSKGSENSEVLKLQQFLFDGGYLTVKPNGYFGAGTVTAVKKFQGANGLAQVGSVGPGTRGKIKEVGCGGVVIKKEVSAQPVSKNGIKDCGIVDLIDLAQTPSLTCLNTSILNCNPSVTKLNSQNTAVLSVLEKQNDVCLIQQKIIKIKNPSNIKFYTECKFPINDFIKPSNDILIKNGQDKYLFGVVSFIATSSSLTPDKDGWYTEFKNFGNRKIGYKCR